MNFNEDNFKVYMLYNADVLRIFNESKYKCRVHFFADGEKTSLLCNAGTGRFVNNYDRVIKLKTIVKKNKKTLLHLDDLQPYFKDDETHQEYLAWRFEVDNTNQDDSEFENEIVIKNNDNKNDENEKNKKILKTKK